MQASVKLEERMARLVLIRDEDDLVAHKLRNVTTIGRASLNHIVIDDPAVSAQHAIIARSADSYRLQDLHSTNGTRVNGLPVRSEEHTSELQSRENLVCRLLLEKKKKKQRKNK